MNGGQDLGGMMGFGPIAPEKDEPVFHAEWEKRAFALTLASFYPGGWNIDQSRFARESLHPAAYLSKSYYEIWLAGIESLLGARGLLTHAEIDAGTPIGPIKPVATILRAEEVLARLAKGGVAARPTPRPAAFAPGARVRCKNMHPKGHTRLPRYIRGKIGEIVHVHGSHVFPDANAAGRGEDPQWLYTIAFSGEELWGPDAEPGLTVSVDAFEPYLEALDAR